MSNSSPTPATDIVPGAILAGKYRVERVIGKGGMGLVVEARHIALDERIALKFLLPEYAHHPEAAPRFMREARIAAKIKSEHVVRVSDVGTLDNGAPFMMMEYLEGADLAKTLESSVSSRSKTPSTTSSRAARPSPRPTSTASFTAISSPPTSS